MSSGLRIQDPYHPRKRGRQQTGKRGAQQASACPGLPQLMQMRGPLALISRDCCLIFPKAGFCHPFMLNLKTSHLSLLPYLRKEAPQFNGLFSPTGISQVG